MTSTSQDRTRGITVPQAGRIAGLGLLGMAMLAPFAELYVMPTLLVPGDVVQTALNIQTQRGLFVAGAFAYLVTYTLDVVVAWALWVLLAPVDRALALLAAWLRVVYAALALLQPLKLLTVVRLLDQPDALPKLAGPLGAQIELLLESARYEWTLALLLFGLDLVLLGVLVWRASYVPSFLGVLLALAGAGYVAFNLGPYLLPGVDLAWLLVTFFGELVFMLWLLFRSGRIRLTSEVERETVAA